MAALASATDAQDAVQTTAQPVEHGPLALASNVVSARVDAEGIVLVQLEDRDARNMFSAPSWKDAKFKYKGGTLRLRGVMK